MIKLVSYFYPQYDLSTFMQGYSGYRPDIIKLIENQPSKVLDIGCGAGLLAKEIKKLYPDCKVTGLEANSDLVIKAKESCDQVIQLDLNSTDAICNSNMDSDFDLIIFADVLEHLNEPEIVLKHATKHLANNGRIIISLPNIRHYSTFVRLFLLGSWPRNERGIHDSTHVRFFTKKNIVDFVSNEGLLIEKEARNVRLIESMSWTNIPGKLLDFWPFRPFFTFQYLHRCKLKNSLTEDE